MRKARIKPEQGLLTFLILVLVLISIPAMAATPSDINQHWARQQINDWLQKGYINGYADGSFRPDQDITRAEFMVLVNKICGYTQKAAVSYLDVPSGAWYSDAVAKAKAAGYISGYGDGSIKPSHSISRQEAAMIIMKNRSLKANPDAAQKFNDVGTIGNWGKGAVGATVYAGFMSGYPDGSFKASNPIKRGEAVAALDKLAKTGSPQAAVYDRPGTYGGTEAKTIAGNVLIKSPDVVLQNTTIEGDLTIDKSVGEGNVTLRHVAVKGSTYVKGGGSNSIYFIDTQTGKTYVQKDNGPVRIVASGSSEITQLITQSSVKVEARDLTGTGFGGIVVEKKTEGKIDISLTGIKVESFTLNSGDISVKADKSTTINNLIVAAPGAIIATEKGATIAKLVANAAVSVTGSGTVNNASINANGVTFEIPAQAQTIAPGVASPAAVPANTGGGAAANDSESSRINATPLTAVETLVKQGSIDFGFTFQAGQAALSYAQATGSPYYLDPAASTMTLAGATATSNPVSLGDLGINPADNKLTFDDYAALASKFPILSPDKQLPLRVKFHLSSLSKVGGKTINNPWTYDSDWIDFNTEASRVFSLYAAKMALQVKDGQGQPMSGESLNSITSGLKLESSGLYGAAISWQSSNEAVVSATGNVSRPAPDAADCKLTLTAKLMQEGLSEIKTFELTVKKLGLPVLQPGYPKIANVGETGFDLLVKTDQAGKMYNLLVADGAQPPSVADVIYANNSLALSDGIEASTSFSNLAPKTPYDLYMVFQNNYEPPATSSSAVKMDVGTVDLTPPAFAVNYPKTANIGGSSFDLLLKMDQAGQVYYLLKADGAAASSLAEIKAANNVVAIPAADTEVSFTISGLSDGTSYALYLFAQDDQSSPNMQSSASKLDVRTLDASAPQFLYGYPQATFLNANQFQLLVKINEPGKVHYVCVNHNSTALTINQLKNAASVNIAQANQEEKSNSRNYPGEQDAYFLAEDKQNPPNFQSSLTTLHVKLPAFTSGYPKTANITTSSFELLISTAQPGKVYYLLKTDGAPEPSIDDIKAANHEIAISAANTESPPVTFNGLNENTDYDLYLFSQDDQVNPNTYKMKIDVKTRDNTPPVFASGYPKTSKLDESSFDLLVKLNEAGKVFYQVLANNAAAPSAEQIIAANQSINSDTANTEASAGITGLGPATEYDVYLVAQDSQNPPNKQSSTVKMDVRTPFGFSSGYPKAGAKRDNGFDLLVKASGAGTVYYKAVPGASTPPSADEVIAENKKQIITANTEESITVNSLPSGTTYDVYLVLDDNSPVPVHKNTPARLCVATTGPDSTPPVFAAGYPKFNGLSENNFKRYYHYLLKMNEAGKVYFRLSSLRYPESGLPYWSASEVIANNTMVIDIPNTGEVGFNFSPNNYNFNSSPGDLYFVAADDEATPNQQAIPVIRRLTFGNRLEYCSEYKIQGD